MSEHSAAIPDPPSRAEATLGSLIGRIWTGVKTNRRLFAAVVVVGFLEALFTKAPLLLVKFLLDALEKPAPGKVATPPDGAFAEAAASAKAMIEDGFRSFSRWVYDGVGCTFDNRADMEPFVGCAAGAIVFGLCGSFAIYGMTVLSRFFATKIVVDIRNEVLDHILRLPLRFFARRRMGELISSITNDTAVLSRSFMLACDNVITDPLSILFNFVLVLVFFPQLWWVMVVAVPVMAFPMLKTGRRIHKSSSKSLAAMGDATESMNQVLTGIRTVKAFQLEEERIEEFRESNNRFLHRTRRMLQHKGFSQGLLFASYQIGFAVMLAVIGWLYLAAADKLKFSDVAITVGALATTYNHVKRVVRAFNILNESTGALEGIEAIMRVDPDTARSSRGEVIEEVRGAMAMRDVSFAYDSEPVLRDVNFEVQPGQTVAFVGPSGAGKSTAMDLLARFNDPSSGVVEIDGHDLRDVNLQSYRRHVAMVSQQPFLFNTTILENIRYGRRDATDAEVEEAARQAQIHDFVVGLPDGYRTVVGERGSKLSGGQMQRITIARAIVRNPRILFLDEAMSALDSDSEQAVQKALENLMRGRTSICIAHRLSTIQNADMILVFEEGRIVERGTHEELARQGGVYQRLSELQQLA